MFEPIKSRKLVDQVVEQLETSILEGAFKSGEKLPSEEQLANQLAVGRRSVREALKVLETKGLVEVQVGVGTIVRRRDFDNYLDALAQNVSSYLNVRKAEAKHVMQFRWILEAAGMERLATERDQGRIAAIMAAVAEQADALARQDFAAYQEWHFKFHADLVDALENPILSTMHQRVAALGWRRTTDEDAAIFAQAVREHQKIAESLAAGRLGDARQVLKDQLELFREQVEARQNPNSTGPDGSDETAAVEDRLSVSDPRLL